MIPKISPTIISGFILLTIALIVQRIKNKVVNMYVLRFKILVGETFGLSTNAGNKKNVNIACIGKIHEIPTDNHNARAGKIATGNNHNMLKCFHVVIQIKAVMNKIQIICNGIAKNGNSKITRTLITLIKSIWNKSEESIPEPGANIPRTSLIIQRMYEYTYAIDTENQLSIDISLPSFCEP